MNNYYFYIDKLDVDLNELLREFESIEKNWVCYGKKSNKTLWAIPFSLDLFFKLKSSKQFKQEFVDDVSFFMTKPNGQILPHTDTRPTSLLIPVKGNFQKSRVEFYDRYCKSIIVPINSNDNGQFSNTTTMYKVGIPDYQVSYDKPILINTKIIHAVKNESDSERIVLSISLNKDLSFEQVRQLYFADNLFISA